MEARHFT